MTSEFTRLDWIALPVFFIITFWQPVGYIYNNYESIRKRLYDNGYWYIAFPSMTFPIVWAFLYTFIATGIFIFFKEANVTGTYYIIVMSLFYANLFFNKLWTFFFFGTRQYGWALLDAIMILLTALAILPFLVLEALNQSSVIWAYFGLFIPYVLWLLVAIYINWVVFSISTTESSKKQQN